MITAFYTCPRPVPYIGQTLSNYFEFFPDVVFNYVFEEPDTPGYLNRTKINRIVQTEKQGCVKHWLYVAKWLIRETCDETFLICEDDIQFIKRPILPNADFGFCSAYCSKVNRPISLDRGWGQPYIGRYGLCGALALFFKRRSLEYIVDHENEFINLSQGKHLDFAIGEILKSFTNYIHFPTLVLHTGDVSTIPGNNKPENKEHVARQPAL